MRKESFLKGEKKSIHFSCLYYHTPFPHAYRPFLPIIAVIHSTWYIRALVITGRIGPCLDDLEH